MEYIVVLRDQVIRFYANKPLNYRLLYEADAIYSVHKETKTAIVFKDRSGKFDAIPLDSPEWLVLYLAARLVDMPVR